MNFATSLCSASTLVVGVRNVRVSTLALANTYPELSVLRSARWARENTG